MVFNLRSVTGEVEGTEIKINKVKDLLDLMDKHKCDLIIRSPSYYAYEGNTKLYTVVLYDDYVE